MHHPFLKKYLLIAAIALVVLVVDAFIGNSQSSSNQGSSSRHQAKPEKGSSEAKPVQQLAALSQPAAEASLPTPVEESAPVGSASTSESQLREKLTQQLQTIDNDYKAIAQPIYEQSPPVLSPEDRTKLAYLDQEKFEDLGKVLSTAELEVYQNKTDESAAPKRR